MRATFGDAIVRARGLQSHLLGGADWQALAGQRSLAAVAGSLRRWGYVVAADRDATAAELELAIGQVAADRLNLLARWLGPRQAALRMLLEWRDLLALRAIVRGMAEGASASARLRGVHPSPLLPASLLVRLAGCTSALELHRQLLHIGHPAAPVFATPSSPAPGWELPRLEAALVRWWARRVIDGARIAGRAGRRLAAAAIDQRNLLTLLLPGEWGVETDPTSAYLPGGRVLLRADFLSGADLPDLESRRELLGSRFGASGVGRVLRDLTVPLAAVPRRLRAASIHAARREARIAPLGLGPLVEVILRIEREAEELRRVVHAVALGAPVVIEDAVPRVAA